MTQWCFFDRNLYKYLVLLNITMETVSLKLGETFVEDMERLMQKHRYTTKTEFIREAIREKMRVLYKEISFSFSKCGSLAINRRLLSRQRTACSASFFGIFLCLARNKASLICPLSI